MKKNRETPKKKSDVNKEIIHLTKKKAMGWLVSFCFVSMWIFLLGILVGRGTAPVQFDIDTLQKDLFELRQDLIKKEQKMTENDKDVLAGKPDFEFHETLKESKPNLKSDLKLNRKEKKKELPTSSKKTEHAHKTNKFSKKKHMARIDQKKTVTNKSTPQVAPDSNIKKLTIQVASLRDQKIADQLVASLRKKGYPAYKTVGKLSENNVWYRVRAGYFKNKEDSLPMLARLKKEHKGAILLKR